MAASLRLTLAVFSHLVLRLISFVDPVSVYCSSSHDVAQDGVLLHGANVLPEAKRALSILEGENPFNR